MTLSIRRLRTVLRIITACVFLTALRIPGGAQEVTRENLDFAQVTQVKLTQTGDGRWNADVTVRHNDEGWDHYANIWQILDADSSRILGERILAHPHDNEQPFTRGLSGIRIPAETRRLLVRARCNLHDYEGKQVEINLNVPETAEYQIIR